MIQSLNSYYFRGLNNNIKFLISIFNSENFKNGNIHTGLLDDEYKEGYNYPKPRKKILKNMIYYLSLRAKKK